VFIDGCPIKDNFTKLFSGLKRMNFNTHEIDTEHIRKYNDINEYSNFLYDYIQNVVVTEEDNQHKFYTNKMKRQEALEELHEYHFFNVSPLSARYYLKDNNSLENMEAIMKRFHPHWFSDEKTESNEIDTTDAFMAVTDDFVALQRYGIRNYYAEKPEDGWVTYKGNIFKTEQECVDICNKIRENDKHLLNNYQVLHTTDSKQALYLLLDQLKVPFYVPGFTPNSN